MASTFTAHASAELFANPSHTVALSYFTTFDLLPFPHFETHFVFGFSGDDFPRDGDPIDAMEDFTFANGEGLYFLTVFAGNAVDYSASTAPVFIDLDQATQHGGFAEGDSFVDGTMTGIDGSNFDDIIRGIDPVPPREDVGITANFNNPGDNTFNGGRGNDLLEGRGGADTLNGQSGFDLASYESSPAGVTVRLAGVNGDPQTALASGGDAGGDKLSSIEGLIGSSSEDRLTGNSLDNLLAGGLGGDVLNGMGGIDTVDYSRDHFFDAGDTADRVAVRLGEGVADEFKLQSGGTFLQVSHDTLISIENVIGTAGDDVIRGNDLDNRLEGRGGNNVLDGGLGDDTLIGGSGIDAADYTSHDTLAVQRGEQYVIALGLSGRAGSFTLSEPGVRTGLPPQIIETDVLIGIENVNGSNHAEAITGNEHANTLDGRGGSDILDGGFGDDILIGNGGTDTASYLSHDGLLDDGSPDVISLGNGTSDGSYTRFQALGPIRQAVETDVLRSIENVTGSDSNEVINGNDGINVLDGRGGNDIIDGGLGNDVIIGGNALGRVTSIDTASYVSHDAVTDFFGADLIALGQNGTDGSYTRQGQTGTAETDVLRGIENVTGSNRTEVIIGNEQDNTLDGRGGNDHLVGGAGNDTVNGGADGDVYDFTGVNLGSDRFFDESGADAVIVNTFSDILPDGTGRDGNDLVIHLTTGTFRIVDHFNGHQIELILANDTGQSMVLANGLIGGNGNGIIAGTHKGETLDGRGGDDFLFGGDGKDRLIGGDGNDRLTGGHGPDTFVFGPGFGHDLVTDYSHADHIELDGGVFHNFHQVQAASHQIGNDTVITVDANNSITLLGVNSHSLHSDDFTFV
jgi:Ca2+-binding RTX toxin-like protein